MKLFKSNGVLKYEDASQYKYKLILEVDRGIYFFYRSLIPKWIQTSPQKYAPHISIVRKEQPTNLEHWGKYEGEQIEFEYSNEIHHGQYYWWLNAFSCRLEEIRLELGLPVSSEYTVPPEGYVKNFHITLGNVK